MQRRYVTDKGFEHPEDYVYNSMDEYASQVLDEYKEKLKRDITTYQLLDDTFKNAVFALIDNA